MLQNDYHFNKVTLLITHYNRCDSFERLLKSFQSLNCTFDAIVVSDDGSKAPHLEKLRALSSVYNYKLVEAPVNKGLGNNINKGQDAVETEYTLYIQEDFVPTPEFPEHFKDALEIMVEDGYWDLITFYSYSPYPYLKPYKKGFSEKIFKKALWYTDNLKFYYYGDHPHLRKSTFLQKFGRYEEGLNVDKTEMEMSLSFIKNKGRALFYDDHYGLLDQRNSNDEPSTASYRKTWSAENNLHLKALRWAYLKYKFMLLNIRLLLK